MQNPTLDRRPPPPSETRDPGVLVDVVVLSSDTVLYEAIRGAVGERNPVWRARSAEESVDLLLTGRCGVLLLDMGAVSTRPATLVQQISEQFPDVVVVVAGRREDESLLAQLISDGLVYRFMHKPLTAKRAGMFLHAAIRCHVERRASRRTVPLLPLPNVLPARIDRRKWVFVGLGVALFSGLLGLLLDDGRDATPGGAGRTAGSPAVSESARQPSDPVLSRARAAFAAGRYESPAGRNALDLYAAVLLAEPSQPEALAGLEKTVAWVVGEARKASAAGDSAEAERLLGRLQVAAPHDPATRRLAALLTRHPPVKTANPDVAKTETAATLADAGAVPAGVTRTAMPDPATTAVAEPPSQDGPPARTRPAGHVYSDPLAPRVSNTDDLRVKALIEEKRRTGQLSPGAPVQSLPIAGYVAN